MPKLIARRDDPPNVPAGLRQDRSRRRGGAAGDTGCVGRVANPQDGYVTPATGPLAGFAEADDFNIALFRTLLRNGLKVGGRARDRDRRQGQPVEPDRAAQVAKDLIVQDKINIMLVGDARDLRSGLDAVRDRGSALPLRELPVAGLVLRAAEQPGQSATL